MKMITWALLNWKMEKWLSTQNILIKSLWLKLSALISNRVKLEFE